VWELRNTCRFSVGESEEERPLGISRDVDVRITLKQILKNSM
jgi:hypothetical protein